MRVIMKPNEEHLKRLVELPARVIPRMSDPALLRALGRAHRDQVKENFQTEGATGARGAWERLNAKYAARKRKAVGSKKILHLTGDTESRFLRAGHPDYIERFTPTEGDLGLFQFGAQSDIAAAHVAGNPALATSRSSLPHLFAGKAKRLPVRDMITKTTRNLSEMRKALADWYSARLKQSIKAAGKLGIT